MLISEVIVSEEWPQEIVDLSGIIGRERIERYLRYLDNRSQLSDTGGITLRGNNGGVLLKPDLENLCDVNKRILPLIDPFVSDNLQAASYKLSLGNQYRLGDGVKYLDDNHKVLTIAPHGIAIVTTYEWLNVPAFLIARWNLKVRMVYRGLVWVGSLQVDPGYQGFLFCPIYNLSSVEQQLVYKETLFTIDFVTTKPVSKKTLDLWSSQDSGEKFSTFTFTRLDKQRIKSAPEEAFKRFETIIEQSASSMQNFQRIIWTVLAIIMSAIAIIATFGFMAVKWDGIWIAWMLSIFALIIAVIALVFSIKNWKRKIK